MKRIIILGAGTAGTLMANKLYKKLDTRSWEIVVVEPEEDHYYQPGFLFIPFELYSEKEIKKPVKKFIPSGVRQIKLEAVFVDAPKSLVRFADGSDLAYDYLIIATGTSMHPEETPGLKDENWYKNKFDFYTIEGARALANFLRTWEGGKLALAIVDMPIKCPVAPLEFVFLADSYFEKKGMRDKVEISLVTPLSGAFTKPLATQMLSGLLSEKDIEVVPDFYIERVENASNKLVAYDEREVEYDLLVVIPLHKGADVIINSGLGDDLGFVVTNKKTLQSEKFANIFALGDAANIPASKAGSVAHFAADVLFENLMYAIEGKPLTATFDGHSNCYIETGKGKATLIDFNYNVEPLPGTYPLPFLGPFALLKDTRINHWGKLLFKWIYWNILLKARHLPVSNHMSMIGKRVVKNN